MSEEEHPARSPEGEAAEAAAEDAIPDFLVPWEEVDPFPGYPGAARGRTRIWALVLESRGIASRTRHGAGRTALLVPPTHRFRAEEEIRRYEEENRLWPPAGPHAPPTARNIRSTLVVLAALGLFHDLTLQPKGSVLGIAVDWHGLGAMDAERVLHGEWWRTVTALTLHADGLHLMGNLVLGGILFALLNAQLGVGLGMALAVAAGALGNASNALFRGASHLSLGASTAVFGALGVLTARGAWRTAWRDWRRWVIPLGAGAGVLAMVGVGDQETDYAAHLFGFAWGLVAGLLTRWPVELRRPPGRAASAFLGLATAALVVGAWAAALSPR